eukprot:Platyproteum_vivax@DN6296_c0_g1_i1.p1
MFKTPTLPSTCTSGPAKKKIYFYAKQHLKTLEPYIALQEYLKLLITSTSKTVEVMKDKIWGDKKMVINLGKTGIQKGVLVKGLCHEFIDEYKTHIDGSEENNDPLDDKDNGHTAANDLGAPLNAGFLDWRMKVIEVFDDTSSYPTLKFEAIGNGDMQFKVEMPDLDEDLQGAVLALVAFLQRRYGRTPAYSGKLAVVMMKVGMDQSRMMMADEAAIVVREVNIFAIDELQHKAQMAHNAGANSRETMQGGPAYVFQRCNACRLNSEVIVKGSHSDENQIKPTVRTICKLNADGNLFEVRPPPAENTVENDMVYFVETTLTGLSTVDLHKNIEKVAKPPQAQTMTAPGPSSSESDTQTPTKQVAVTKTAVPAEKQPNVVPTKTEVKRALLSGQTLGKKRTTSQACIIM